MHSDDSGQGGFARLLAAIKQRTGMSDQAIADIAGVNRSQVWRWLHSGAAAGYEPVRRLAAYLLAERPEVAGDASALLAAAGYEMPPPAGPAPPPLLPMARDLALSAGVNPDDPDDRYIKSVRDDLTRAILKHGPSPSGEQVFRGRPGSGYEAALWDDPGIDDRSKEVSIAALRAMRDQHGQGRRRRTG